MSFIKETRGPMQGAVHLEPTARILRSTVNGPVYLARNAQIGPDVTAGKYVAFNESSHFAHGSIGSYCAVGARCCLNARNHPTDWLSTHGFQYHAGGFDFVEEYRDLKRLRPPPIARVTIGNDVWIGNQVNIIGDVSIGDGAIIGAGSIVTRDVPPYAVVYGSPAEVRRFRFSDRVIEQMLRLKWWELELCELNGLPFQDVERCLDAIEVIREGKNAAHRHADIAAGPTAA